MIKPRCSVRMQKLTNARAFRKADIHNRRLEEVPHADPAKPVMRLLGDERPIADLVDERIKQAKAKPKRDSVKAVELVMITSPEFFRPHDPGAWGEYDEKRMAKWRDETLDHLKSKFGDNLVAVDLHLDEATPHIHAIVVPLTEKKVKRRQGKKQKAAGEPPSYYTKMQFDCKNQFNKAGLRALQTDYAKALESLGIARGIKGSKRKHEHSKEYYRDAKQNITPKLPELDLPDEAGEHWNPYQRIKELEAENRKLRKALTDLKKGVKKTYKALVGRADNYRRKLNQVRQQAYAYFDRFDDPDQALEQLNSKEQQLQCQARQITKLEFENAGLQNQIKKLTPEPTPAPKSPGNSLERERQDLRPRESGLDLGM